MKTISRISAILFSLSIITLTGFAQSSHSCCAKPATAMFAMLGNDESFKASHLSPLPFHYVSPAGQMITFQAADGKTTSAFEIKAKASTQNYLFVIHEWWGLNDYMKQEAEKLQNELGNVNVLALDLFDGKVATNSDEASKYMSEAKEERIRAIINGAITYVGKDARIQTIGWCFGGGWSLQASMMTGKQGVGCVMYYGMPETDAKKMQAITFPILGLFALKDDWIKPEMVNQFENEMKKYNKKITVKSFDAVHAFANPSNPKHDKAAAAEAHTMAIAFLKKNLR
jgi:carboxymethylenebutenolidase